MINTCELKCNVQPHGSNNIVSREGLGGERIGKVASPVCGVQYAENSPAREYWRHFLPQEIFWKMDVKMLNMEPFLNQMCGAR